MASQELKIGDLVRLTPKGQVMRITAKGTGDGHWFCEWHDKNGMPHGQKYPAEALILAEDDK